MTIAGTAPALPRRRLRLLRYLGQNHPAAAVSLTDHSGDPAAGIISDVRKSPIISNNASGSSITLFGHSMGSLVVLYYMQQYDQDINRLSLSVAHLAKHRCRSAITIAKQMKLFRGERHRSKLINHLAFWRL